MNVMATNHARVTSRRWIREHLVLFRRSGGGDLECETCGGPALTQAELADSIGISPSTLRKFLARQPVRQEIANRIRDAVKAVHE